MFAFALFLAAAPQTATDLAIDADRVFTRADAALNEQYRATMAKMKLYDTLPQPRGYQGPTHASALLAAQRAWLQFREAECVSQGLRYLGRPPRAMEVSSCKAALTRDRTAQLRELAPQ